MTIAIMASNSTHLNFQGSVSSRTIHLVKTLASAGHSVILYCLNPDNDGLGIKKGTIPLNLNCEVRFFNNSLPWEEQVLNAICEVQNTCEIIHSTNVLFKNPDFPINTPLLIDVNYPIDLVNHRNIYYVTLCDDFKRKYRDQIFDSYIPFYSCKELTFTPLRGDYFLWLGRLNQEKAPELLIELAARSPDNIYVCGLSEPYNIDYAVELERRFRNGGKLIYCGFVQDQVKADLIQKSKGLLYTCDWNWHEPSGTIFFEAMKCGKPVIGLTSAFNAINDYVIHGKTGFICNGLDELLLGMKLSSSISPDDCYNQYSKLSNEQSFYERIIDIYQRVLSMGAV